MNTPRLSSISLAVSLIGALVAACGKPVGSDGKPDQAFGQAGMGTPGATPTPSPTPATGRPLANDVSIEVVSWLVSFNRLQTASALEDALNRKPGQFSHVDSDADGVLDYIAVVERPNPDGGHSFELRTRPQPGQTTPEVVVATMMFDKEWAFAGHYDGAIGGVAATATAVAAAAPVVAAAPADAGAPAATAVAAAAPVVAAAPAVAPAAAPSVQAVPAGSDVEAGIAARP